MDEGTAKPLRDFSQPDRLTLPEPVQLDLFAEVRPAAVEPEPPFGIEWLETTGLLDP